MLSCAVVTTSADSSVEYFPPEFAIYAYDRIIPEDLKNKEIIYFRDPFNTGIYNLDTIAEKIATVVESNPGAYYVDDIQSLTDILIEDKWRQYSLLKEYMPRTKLLESPSEINDSTIAKKRISARARGIAFHPNEVKGDVGDYVLQERMTIHHEYRVYVVCGKVQPIVGQRSSKTATSKVKVLGLENLTSDIKLFSESISSKVPKLDFFGLDIAVTDEGLKLIELNRSPQFGRYGMLGGGDLINHLIEGVEKRINY